MMYVVIGEKVKVYFMSIDDLFNYMNKYADATEGWIGGYV